MELPSFLSKETNYALHDLGFLQEIIKSILVRNIIKDVHIEKAKIDENINNFCKSNKIEIDEYDEWLIKNSYSKKSMEIKLTASERIQIYSKDNFNAKVKARFLDKKNYLDKVVYSLIRVKDYYKAKELYMRISEGEADFGDIASEFSEGPESLTRGIVGPVELGSSHPLLLQKLKSLGKHELYSDIIEINNWHLILRLENHIPSKLDENMESFMQKELFEEYITSESKTILNNLFEKGLI